MLSKPLVLFLALSAFPAFAQWTADITTNTAVAGWENDQMHPALGHVPTVDGGWFIAYYADSSGYFSVLSLTLSGFTRVGESTLGPIVVTDFYPPSDSDDSVADPDIDVDASANAFLAFMDYTDSSNAEVAIAKVSQIGVREWGNNRLIVSGTNSLDSDPRVAQTGDGGAVIAWTSANSIELQKHAANGSVVWHRTIQGGPGRYLIPVDIDASDNGSVILGYRREQIGGTARRYLVTKFDSGGFPLWGTLAGVMVTDSFEAQTDYDPQFAPDGAGGTVVAWCSAAFRCYAQQIRANGTKRFASDGLAVTSTPLNEQFEAAVARDVANDAIAVIWRERSGLDNGIRAQRISADGTRSWGTSGVSILPLGAQQVAEPVILSSGNDFVGLWIHATSYQQETNKFARLNALGTMLCGPADFAAAVGEKRRLRADADQTGQVVATWQVHTSPEADIYAQNINIDCTFGLRRVPDEVSPSGSIQPLRFTSATRLQWEPAAVSRSDRFNLYRGDIVDLPTRQYGDCLQADLLVNITEDFDVPLAGTSWYYLVTGENEGGEGPLGFDVGMVQRFPHAYCP